MSVTICWRPGSDKGRSFESGTSSDLEVLKDVFGSFVDVGNLTALRAMAKATRNSFYNEVADTVESVGLIEFWGEY